MIRPARYSSHRAAEDAIVRILGAVGDDVARPVRQSRDEYWIYVSDRASWRWGWLAEDGREIISRAQFAEWFPDGQPYAGGS